ncbi:MAG: MBL fold metallo-hydrolase [Acidimicrobiia bacterium]|nr:MBL fold metallo-hydrolase [Acidimicrobiia bacterium]
MLTIDLPTARIRSLSVGPLDNNVYIVSCKATGKAAIVDAANEADRILAAADDVDPQVVLTTHGHADHLGAVSEVTAALGIPFRLHEADRVIASRSIDEPLLPCLITVGEISIGAIHTPGHTPGSMCFVIDGVVLTGDTLFPGGPGATRFPYSDFDQIMNSLHTQLFSRPDETRILPGHGAPTMIGTERPHLAEWTARRW